MTILGIDPGINGAISVLSDDGDLLAVHDLPSNAIKINGTNRKVVDPVGLIALLTSIGHAKTFIERVGPRPTDGASAAYGFGYAVGIIHTALESVRYPFEQIAPITWRRAMGLPAQADKNDSRALATELFPACANQWPRAKDHDRAEAALIGAYGHSQLEMAMAS